MRERTRDARDVAVAGYLELDIRRIFLLLRVWIVSGASDTSLAAVWWMREVGKSTGSTESGEERER